MMILKVFLLYRLSMAFVIIRFLISIDTTKPRIAGLCHLLIYERLKLFSLLWRFTSFRRFR
ncbi:hypothetical protein P3564_23745, partial [Vibrio parahaemolyticus]|nr:hypothetical protein [Vibrio parahaemolyticus]